MRGLILVSFLLRLIRDPRVPTAVKVLAILGAGYALFPGTWLSFGIMDNLLAAGGGLAVLLLFSRRSVIKDLWKKSTEQSRMSKDKSVVDVNYKILDDEQD